MNAPARAAACVPVLASREELLAAVLIGQRAGRGALPYFLGLSPEEFTRLTGRGLPEVAVEDALAWERGDLRQQLLELRRDEWLDVRELLLAHRAGSHPLEAPMADIVAAGCLGGEHLWRDLGLASRAELGALMALFFPALAARNDRDMKWKKFFYKQLCEQEGGYVCRAPSCEECAAWDDCFGAED